MNDEQPVKADPSKFWALVELFGHSQVAGEVSEFVLGFSSFFLFFLFLVYLSL